MSILLKNRDSDPDTNNSGCLSCNGDSNEDHPCPYLEDIEGDSETMCNCCDDCTNECANDI